MVAGVQNILNEGVKENNMLKEVVVFNEMATDYEVEEESFLACTIGKSNLFFLSIFTHISSHGFLYSVPANYRTAMNRTLVNDDG